MPGTRVATRLTPALGTPTPLGELLDTSLVLELAQSIQQVRQAVIQAGGTLGGVTGGTLTDGSVTLADLNPALQTAITDAINAYQLPTGGITATDLSAAVGAALNAAASAVQPTALTAAITAEATTRAAAVTAEATTRAAAITAAQTAITTEASRATAAEQTLTTAVAAEATARAAAVTAEATARAAADAALATTANAAVTQAQLTSALAALDAVYTTADTTTLLQLSIPTGQGAVVRIADDGNGHVGVGLLPSGADPTKLASWSIVDPDPSGAAAAALTAAKTYADGLNTTEVAARAAGDTTEATARAAGDATNATAITTEATARAAADTTNASAITAEATARTAADTTNATAITTEATTRATAITTEATARATADTTEATARAAADTTNASAITAEATARATAITTEATARATADTTEATARAAGDALLLPYMPTATRTLAQPLLPTTVNVYTTAAIAAGTTSSVNLPARLATGAGYQSAVAVLGGIGDTTQGSNTPLAVNDPGAAAGSGALSTMLLLNEVRWFIQGNGSPWIVFAGDNPKAQMLAYVLAQAASSFAPPTADGTTPATASSVTALAATVAAQAASQVEQSDGTYKPAQVTIAYGPDAPPSTLTGPVIYFKFATS